MGCGSSRSTVSVEIPEQFHKDRSVKKTSNLNHFIIAPSTKELSSQKLSDKNEDHDEHKLPESNCGSLKSIKNIDKTVIKLNSSQSSLRSMTDREKSASSTQSRDSGVCDDRCNSAGTASVSSKSSISKSSSARKKLLRIDDATLLGNEESSMQTGSRSVDVISKPKSRLGNLAFDIVLDAPETGNIKKRQLPRLQQKRKKSSRKIKTKEDIDRKMEKASERRKIQEVEKQMKAKQFQHLSIHTTVQPFECTPSGDESDINNINSNEHSNTGVLPLESNQNEIKVF